MTAIDPPVRLLVFPLAPEGPSTHATPPPALQHGARQLQAAGAAFIAIACNTAHHWHADIAVAELHRRGLPPGSAIGTDPQKRRRLPLRYRSAKCCHIVSVRPGAERRWPQRNIVADVGRLTDRPCVSR
jgi:hypothetical protein